MLNFAPQSIEAAGRIVETEYLASVNKKRYAEMYGGIENLRFKRGEEERARKAVEEMQPWKDPSDPEPDFANDLHALIADKLELENYEDLEFYTAVNSHLDIYFGQDAFFKLKHHGEELIVSLDLTANEQKYSSKADVIIHVPKDYLVSRNENPNEYKSILAEATRDIVAKLKRKIH